MYDILQYDWKTVTYSDYDFMRNTSRMVIELKAEEYSDKRISDDSDVLVFYNMYDGKPMILIERIERILKGDELTKAESLMQQVPGFVGHIELNEDKEYTDVVFTSKNLYDSLVNPPTE